jgi:hypothetical protein
MFIGEYLDGVVKTELGGATPRGLMNSGLECRDSEKGFASLMLTVRGSIGRKRLTMAGTALGKPLGMRSTIRSADISARGVTSFRKRKQSGWRLMLQCSPFRMQSNQRFMFAATGRPTRKELRSLLSA